MPSATRAAKPRSPRAAIQAVAVEMTDAECDDFDGWLRRATAAGGAREPLIKFATWYPAVAQRWFDAATASGVLGGGREPGRRAHDYCRSASESLSHAERSDGVMVHFVVDTASRPYAFRAGERPDLPAVIEQSSRFLQSGARQRSRARLRDPARRSGGDGGGSHRPGDAHTDQRVRHGGHDAAGEVARGSFGTGDRAPASARCKDETGG